jgi:DNA mismatch endonuclease (patch repair protein)
MQRLSAKRDTGPELALRRELHRLGLRYRVDAPPLPAQPRRRADVVFRPVRVAVYVDGCFWHGCPQHGRTPTSNATWWAAKIDRNRERDVDTNSHLEAAGWSATRIWEHDDPRTAAVRIAELVRSRR